MYSACSCISRVRRLVLSDMADLDVQHILAEAAAVEAVAEDVLGRPEILDESGDMLAAADADVPPRATEGAGCAQDQAM